MSATLGLADLTQCLLDGAYETELWSTFLSQLSAATNSDFAILLCQPPGWRQDDALQLIWGDARIEESKDIHRRHFVSRDPNSGDTTSEATPYSLRELIEQDQGEHTAFYTELTQVHGVSDIRQIRVREPSGVDAWLTIVRKVGAFDRDVDRLLEQLAPFLRGVLRNYVTLQRESFTASLAAEAIRRLQFGWLALDRHGKVVDCDDVGSVLLQRSGMLSRSGAGRLKITDANTEKAILDIIRVMSTSVEAQPRAVSLSRDPWLDMLLVPAPRRFIGTIGKPVVVAYIHGDSWRIADRCGQLIDLFRLTKSEARLALELCRGRSIAEAADDLGLQVETARGYSKKIYAKIGARGQADLVRILMGSVLALAPDIERLPR